MPHLVKCWDITTCSLYSAGVLTLCMFSPLIVLLLVLLIVHVSYACQLCWCLGAHKCTRMVCCSCGQLQQKPSIFLSKGASRCVASKPRATSDNTKDRAACQS